MANRNLQSTDQTKPRLQTMDITSLKAVLADLRKKSEERVKNSILFKDLQEKKQWQENNEVTYLELNYDIRLQKKTTIEDSLLDMENKLRRKLNLSTFENYQDFLDREEDPEELDISSKVLDPY